MCCASHCSNVITTFGGSTWLPKRSTPFLVDYFMGMHMCYMQHHHLLVVLLSDLVDILHRLSGFLLELAWEKSGSWCTCKQFISMLSPNTTLTTLYLENVMMPGPSSFDYFFECLAANQSLPATGLRRELDAGVHPRQPPREQAPPPHQL